MLFYANNFVQDIVLESSGVLVISHSTFSTFSTFVRIISETLRSLRMKYLDLSDSFSTVPYHILPPCSNPVSLFEIVE